MCHRVDNVDLTARCCCMLLANGSLTFVHSFDGPFGDGKSDWGMLLLALPHPMQHRLRITSRA